MPNLLRLPTWSDDHFVHVVIATDELEAKQLSFLGWASAKKARQLIKQSAATFAKG
jgi:hypothetical protein